ncbi:MAG: RecX family transcriptional regulator [Ignavibacteria bacterium]|nr:RecX family transcriptional regulator [Ignavibacteria bacterium]
MANVITSIKQNVKNKNRCSVYVDGEFFLACHFDVMNAFGLKTGVEISSDVERELRAADYAIKLKQRLYGFVTYKPRTEKQVRDYLLKHEAAPEECERLIAWSIEFKLLDDVAYATNFIDATKSQKPMSAAAIRQRLRGKGIPSDIIDAAIENQLTNDDVFHAALAVAERKMKILKKMENKDVQIKLNQFLRYRGFDWSTIKQVVSQLFVFLFVCVALFFGAAQILGAQVQSQSACFKVRLDESINRYQPTTIPVLSADGVLYLDRKLHPQNRDGTQDVDEIWSSSLTSNGRHSEAAIANVSSFRQPDVLFNFSSDGLEALVVGDYSYNGSDSVACFAIIKRTSSQGKFDKVEPIVIPGMSRLSSNYYGNYNKELNVIILALETKNGLGDLDLYFTTLCNGRWTPLLSLGPSINTSFSDASPWLAPDGRSLFFASNGRSDKRGKLDLYVSKRIGEGFQSWTAPVNLGACINTVEDDSFLSLFGKSDSAMITSWDAVSGRPGVYKILVPYEVQPLPTCKFTAKIIDAQTGNLIPHAYVTLSEKRENKSPIQCELPRFSIDEATTFAYSVLRENNTYYIVTHADGYASHKQTVGVRNLDSTTGVHLTIRLFKTDAPLGSVFFEMGSAVPSSEQIELLRKLVDSYKIRSVKFKVTGYTDQIGTVPLNSTLSFKRAEAIKQLLIAFGLPSSSITAVGKGIENPGVFTGLKENPQSRRVDIFPSSASIEE